MNWMRYFKFNPRKYGFPLDMDLHRFQGNPDLDFEAQPHTIDFFEIMFFEQVSGTFITNGHEVSLEDNTLIFASPNQIKQLPADEPTVRGYHLVFKSAFLEHFFQDQLFVYRLSYFYNYSFPPYLKIDPATFALISTCLNEIISEINMHQADSQEIIRSMLYFILTKLNRCFKEFHHLDQHWQKEDTLIRFKMAIEEHVSSNKNVNDYADLLGLHRNVLNRQLKSLSGLNASDLLADRKLQEIKSRLFFSDHTIAEIAYDLSFSDPNNMTRFFKQRTGQSPSQFRRQVQIDR